MIDNKKWSFKEMEEARKKNPGWEGIKLDILKGK